MRGGDPIEVKFRQFYCHLSQKRETDCEAVNWLVAEREENAGRLRRIEWVAGILKRVNSYEAIIAVWAGVGEDGA